MRRVKFWHKHKPLLAIQQYIRKSPGVKSEADLLAKVSDVNTYPAYITWEDSPSAGSQPPETPPLDAVHSDNHTEFSHRDQPMAQDTANHVHDRLPSPSSIGSISQGEQAGQDTDLPDAQSDSDEEVVVDHSDASEAAAICGAYRHGGPGVLLSYDDADLDAVVVPFVPYADFGPGIYSDTSFWNSRLSITPLIEVPCPALQSGSGSQQADLFVKKVLGQNQELQDGCSSDCIKAFLRHCCEAMFHHNRQDIQACDFSINAAVQSYNHIIERHFEWTLTTLNNMLFLLQLYGHHLLAENILASIYHWITVPGGSDFAIARTIAFKMDLPMPPQRPSYDLDMLRSICYELAQTSSAESPLCLTAQFNLAWASLEMATSIKIPHQSDDSALQDARRALEQQRVKALQEPRRILEGIRSACERVFGPFQIQTITCLATLARVYLNTNQGVMAELLINDVTTRVEGSFPKTHPLYWESKNRQALFTMKLAEMDVRPDRTNEYWNRGESLLRDVLVWRAGDSGLGMSNPQTARTIEALKHWLRQQGRMMEAENVSGWLVEKLEGAQASAY